MEGKYKHGSGKIPRLPGNPPCTIPTGWITTRGIPMLSNSHSLNSHPENSHLIEFPSSEFPPVGFSSGNFPLGELRPGKFLPGEKMEGNYELTEIISIYNCVLFLPMESF